MLQQIDAQSAVTEEDQALIEEFLKFGRTVRDDFAQLEQLTGVMLTQYRTDIQSLLDYTVSLKGAARNPFAKALDFPLHPLMNLI